MWKETSHVSRLAAKASLIAALALPLAAIRPAYAEPLAPMQGMSIDAGHNVRGVIYYVPDERDAYHLVVTLGAGRERTLFRFKAVLSDGQEIELSTPGATGEPPQRMIIHRDGETLNVSQPGA